MARVLTEIWDKQSKGLPVLPLKDTGHQWQLLVAGNEWKYSYDGYARQSKTKKCRLDFQLAQTLAGVSMVDVKQQEDEPNENAASEAIERL